MRMRTMLAVLAPTRVTVMGTGAVVLSRWFVDRAGMRLLEALSSPAMSKVMHDWRKVMGKLGARLQHAIATDGSSPWMLLISDWLLMVLSVLVTYVVVCLIVRVAVARHAKGAAV